MVFLDRDGVLNRRIVGDYVRNLDEFELLPGAVDAVAALNRAGFRTVVVTNQRGLALGRLAWPELDVLHAHLQAQVAAAGGQLSEFYVCPHDNNAGCACRKPQPGLLDAAAAVEPVDWDRAFLVGDQDSDIAAGLARGVITLKVGPVSKLPAHVQVASLADAVPVICGWSF